MRNAELRSFLREARSRCPELTILENEPMSRHTTFRVGGPADVLVTPEAEKLAAVTGACREAGEPYYIVGNGSNLLVGDGGIRGVVILTRDGMDEISADGVRITAVQL